MTAAFVVGVYFLYRWGEEQTWKWAILAALFAGFAVLVKVVIAFLVIGAAVAVVLAVFGRRFWRSAQVWGMAVIMSAPGIGYYVLGHPGRSTDYFFSWTVDLIKLITSVHFYADWLGFVGSLFGITILFLSVVGTLLASTRVRWLLIGLWAGYALYGLTLPFQMLTHSYYHIQLVPVVALGLVPVIDAVVNRASTMGRGWKAALIAALVVLFSYEAWAGRSAIVAEDYSKTPGLWATIGQAIPANAEVIALTQDYGFDLMYWGWRRVDLWPLATDLATVPSRQRRGNHQCRGQC